MARPESVWFMLMYQHGMYQGNILLGEGRRKEKRRRMRKAKGDGGGRREKKRRININTVDNVAVEGRRQATGGGLQGAGYGCTIALRGGERESTQLIGQSSPF